MVAGLVLAAGSSSRMGQPKQLLPFKGSTLLDHVLNEALKSTLDIIVLVLGHDYKKIKEGISTDLKQPKIRVVENRDYQKGLSTSIISGLARVEDRFDHLFIILADMPFVTSGLIDLLIQQFLSSGATLGAVKGEKGRSHPVIFSRKLYPELRQLKGDMGGRNLFVKYENQVCLVDPGKAHKDMDIDTPEEYLACIKR
jgi:molybdenum cofactor cytidylyltransferase